MTDLSGALSAATTLAGAVGTSVMARYEVKRAQVALASGDVDQAATILSAVIERLQKRRQSRTGVDLFVESTARSVLGQTLRAAGRTEEAQEQFVAAVEAWPQKTAVPATGQDLAAYAIASEAVGFRDKAIDRMQEARRRGDVSAASARSLARWLTEEGRLNEAQQTLKEASDVNPLDADLALARAHLLGTDRPTEASEAFKVAAALLVRADRPAEAMEALCAAVGYSPGDASARARLAQLLWDAGRRDEAWKELDQAVHADARNPFVQATRARFFGASGQLVEAAEALERALSRKPQTAEVLAIAANVEAALGRPEAAVTHLRKAVKLEPEVQAWRASLAEAAFQAGRTSVALSVLDDAEGRFQEAGWIFLLRGEIAAAMDQREKALDFLKRAAELEPENGRVYASMGRVLKDLEQYQDALAALERAASLGRESAADKAVHGEVLWILGRSGRAIDLLRSSVEEDPLPETRALLGEVLRTSGATPAATEELSAAIATADDDKTAAFAHASRGAAYAELGRLDDAVQDLQWARELLPGYAWAEIVLGDVLNEAGRSEEALKIFDAAVAARPADADAHRGRGDTLRQLGRHHEAISALERAVSLSPADVTVRRLLGYTYLGAGRLDQALAQFVAALDLSPGDSALLSELAGAHAATGDYERAAVLAERALESDPTNATVLRTKGWLLCDLGEFEAAAAFLDDALRTVEPDAPLLLLQGWAHQHVGGKKHLRRAVKALEQALALDPTEPWTLKSLGNVLRALDPADERARAVTERAIKEAPQRITAEGDRLALVGWCTYALGRAGEAIKLLEQCFELDPSQLGTEFDIALATLCSGEYERAEKRYRAARKHADFRPARRRRGLLLVARHDLRQASTVYPKLDTTVVKRCESRLTEALEKAAQEAGQLSVPVR